MTVARGWRGDLRQRANGFRSDRPLVGIVAAAMVGGLVRIVWVVVAARPPQGLFDPARYAGYADQIASGNGLTEPLTGQPTAYFPPGYPWFLGIIEWLGRHSPLPDDLALLAGLVQAVLGAVTVVVAGVLARRIHSATAGVVTAAVLALYPNLVMHSGTLLSETLAIAVMMVLLLALVPTRSGDGAGSTEATTTWTLPGWRRVAGAGAGLGALILIRPQSAVLVIAIAAVWWVAARAWRPALGRAGLLVVVALAVMAPWTVRNAIRMDGFVALSTNTGDNLCIGHAPGATGGFGMPEACETGTGVQDGPEAEVASNDTKTSRALRFVRTDPGRQPGLVIDRAVALFERDDGALRAVQSYGLDPWLEPDEQVLLGRATTVGWVVVGIVGGIGMLLLAVLSRPSRRRPARPDQLLVPLSALALLAVPLVTFGDARFKVPAIPLLAVGVGVVVAEVARLWPHPSTGGISPDRPHGRPWSTPSPPVA